MTILLPLLGFIFVSLLVAGAAMAMSPSSAGTIERRLGEVTAARTDPFGEPAPTAGRSSPRSSASAPWRRGRWRKSASCSSA